MFRPIQCLPLTILGFLSLATPLLAEDPKIDSMVILKSETALASGSQLNLSQPPLPAGSSKPAFRIYSYFNNSTDKWWLLKDDSGTQLQGWVDSANAWLLDDPATLEMLSKLIREKKADASVFIIHGMIEHRRGEYNIAISDFKGAIGLEMGNAAAWYHRGLAKQAKGDLDAATADFKLAESYAGTNAKAILALAAKRVNGKIDPTPTTALSPESDETKAKALKQGMDWRTMKNYESAIVDFNEVIRKWPNDPAGYHERALTKRDRDDDKRDEVGAIKDFDLAIKVSPDDSASLLERGRTHLANQDHAKAGDDFKKIITIAANPDATRRAKIAAQTGIGEIAAQRGFAEVAAREALLKEAVGEFDKAIEIGKAPANPPPDELMKTKIALAEAYAQRGAAKRGLKDTKGAIEDDEQALRLDPKSATAHHLLALLHLDSGELSAALTELNEACLLNPNSVESRLSFAWVLATGPDDSLRNGPRAVILASVALSKAKWDRGHALDVLAAAQAEAGNFPAAKDSIAQAIKAIEVPADRASLVARQRLYQNRKPYRENPDLRGRLQKLVWIWLNGG